MEKVEKGRKDAARRENVREALAKAGEALGSKLGVRSAPKHPNRSKLLISIVNTRDEAALKEAIDDFSVSLSVAFAGLGTAHSQVLDYLGIGETEKVVVLSLIPESDEEATMRSIRTKISLYLVGRGISFTVPLTAISEIVANGIASAASEKSVDGSKIMTSETRKYDLIVASLAAGFAEEAMEAARQAGAAGGTIIHAHAMNNAKAEQFIGVSIMEERDILLILCKRDGKLPVMQALFEKVGLKTQANGIIFSLPVDRTAGISAADEAAEEHA